MRQQEQRIAYLIAYLNVIEARLRQWDARAEQLRARAELKGDDAKIDYYKQRAVLLPGREAIQALLERGAQFIAASGQADDAAWERLKADIDAAWDDLKDRLDTAVERVK